MQHTSRLGSRITQALSGDHIVVTDAHGVSSAFELTPVDATEWDCELFIRTSYSDAPGWTVGVATFHEAMAALLADFEYDRGSPRRGEPDQSGDWRSLPTEYTLRRGIVVSRLDGGVLTITKFKATGRIRQGAATIALRADYRHPNGASWRGIRITMTLSNGESSLAMFRDRRQRVGPGCLSMVRTGRIKPERLVACALGVLDQIAAGDITR